MNRYCQKNSKKQKTPLIGIWGAWYSSKNVGDQAILISITNLIKKYIPDIEFFVPCSNPEFLYKEHGFRSYSHRKQLIRILSTIAKLDLFIIGGGTPFYDDWVHMLYCLVLVLMAKFFRVPIMVYAVSTQDIKTKFARYLTKFVLVHSDIVSIRELVTVERIKSLGVKREIHLTSDPAITLTPISPPELEKIFEDEGINGSEQPLIGICAHFFSTTDAYRVHHYQRFSEEVIKNYKNVMAQIADYLSSIGKVVFIPMHAATPDNDVEAAEEIIKLMKYSSKVKSITKQYNPQEICSIFSRLDLIIGIRLHSLVIAAAANTPIVSISYAPKLAGFINIIEQSQYMCELESLSFEDLKSKVENALSNKGTIKNILKSKVQQLQRQAEENALRAARLCKL